MALQTVWLRESFSWYGKINPSDVNYGIPAILAAGSKGRPNRAGRGRTAYLQKSM